MFNKQIKLVLDMYFKKFLIQGMLVLSLLWGVTACLLIIGMALILRYPTATWWVVLVFILVWLIYLTTLAICFFYKDKQIEEASNNDLMNQLFIVGGEVALLCLQGYLSKKRNKN